MKLPRARIVRDTTAVQVAVVASEPCPHVASARIVRREILDAQQHAARVVGEANARAQEILDRAKLEAAQLLEQARQQGRNMAQAELAACLAAFRSEQATADHAAQERIVEIARLLAERVIHEQLRLAPELVVPMAREAIAQFWRARSITVRAATTDIAQLQKHVHELGIPAAVLTLEVDDTCAPGSLRVLTEQGGLDADVGLQLDRLLDALRK